MIFKALSHLYLFTRNVGSYRIQRRATTIVPLDVEEPREKCGFRLSIFPKHREPAVRAHNKEIRFMNLCAPLRHRLSAENKTGSSEMRSLLFLRESFFHQS
jgi:hypothetical protein